jgi:hypothetical protein
VALAGSGVLLATAAIVAIWAQALLPQMPGFVPASVVSHSVASLLIASILLTPFGGVRLGSTVMLGATYLFLCFVSIAYLLVSAGTFSTNGLFGATVQTGPWFWVIWHFGEPLGVLAYVLLDWRDRKGSLPGRGAVSSHLIVACTALIVATLLVALGFGHPLPAIIQNGGGWSKLFSWVVMPAQLALCVVVVTLLVWQTGCRTLLQLAVAVSLWLTPLSAVLGWLGRTKYSLGWYVARADAPVEAGIVLMVLYAIMRQLYRELGASEHRICCKLCSTGCRTSSISRTATRA